MDRPHRAGADAAGRRWVQVRRDRPCPACGKTHWCAWTADGWLKCERSTEAPPGMVRVKLDGRGALFRPADPVPNNGRAAKPKATPTQTFPTLRSAISALKRQHGTPSATWMYRDTRGDPVGTILRWDKSDGKRVLPVSRRGQTWAQTGMYEPRPLYRLPELLAAPPGSRVYVVEGEKCADAAVSLGLIATTSAHGSQAAAKTEWTPLRGRDVVILPDADDAGERYVRDVARLAFEAGAKSVRIVRLPDLPDKGDIADYIERMDSREPESIAAGIENLADEAEPLEPGDQASGPVLVCMAGVEAREVSWLWRDRIPLGRVTLLVGAGGLGKSFLTTYMAATVSRGRTWTDGAECPKGSVLMVLAEDDPHDTVRPRLDVHGADLERVHLLPMVRRIDAETGEPRERPFTLADVDELETALKTIPDVRLIVVDPIGSFIGGRVDAHRDNEVRAMLAPIAKLAEKYGPAVVVVAHRRKSAAQAADDMAIGSRAFTTFARSVWHLSRDAKDKARRLLLAGKQNLGPEAPGLAFTIEGHPPAILWEPEPIAMSADEGLAAETASGNSRTKTDAAEDWVRDELADGEVPTPELQERARAAGFSWTTVKRALDSIGAKPRREGFGPGARYSWGLSPCGPNPSRRHHVGLHGPHGQNTDGMGAFERAAPPSRPHAAQIRVFGLHGPQGRSANGSPIPAIPVPGLDSGALP